MFKLSEKEIQLIEEAADEAYQENFSQVKEEVSWIFSVFEKRGIDPEKRLAEIASQEKWDGQKYGGDSLYEMRNLNGGLQENVFSNMFAEFYLHAGRSEAGYIIHAVLLARFMKKDPKIDLLVRSIMSGAKKVQEIKAHWDWRSKMIFHILSSLID